MLEENNHRGCYLVSEANGRRSRETVILKQGENLEAGTVLGKIETTGKYVKLAPAATNGSEVAAAVLYDNVNATADKNAVITARDTEVNGKEIIYPSGATEEQKQKAREDLASLGIIIR